MNRKLILISLVLAGILISCPTLRADQGQKNYDATIEGRQSNGAFVTAIATDTIMFKNWTVKMYTWQTGQHDYSLAVDGDEKLSGTFSGFYAEKTIKVSKGTNYKVSLTIDDKNFNWRKVDVMRKRVDEDTVKGGGGIEKIMKDPFSWLIERITYIALGVIATVLGMLSMYKYVEHKQNHEILEGF